MAPQGPSYLEHLIAKIEDPASSVPQAARACLVVLVSTLRHLQSQIVALDAEISARVMADDTARRLMSVPGIGPLIATAIEALAPAAEAFTSGRDFAAWVGLRPVQPSTKRQGAARTHVPHWRANLAPPVDYRRERCRALGSAQRRCGRHVARPDVGSQATDAGHRGAGQKDRACRLGAVDQRRDLPSSGRVRVSGADARLSEV